MTGVPLPTGMLTFLLSDIESSTDLVRRVGNETYAVIRGHHHAILREAFAENQGREIDTSTVRLAGKSLGSTWRLAG